MEDPANPSYLWLITGPVHVSFFVLTCTVSLISNVALILAVIVSKSAEIGSYGYLLICFAFADIFTSTMHVVSLPHLHMTSTGYWYLPRNDGIFRSKGGIIAIIFTFVYIASFYQTFLILSYHFIYRVRALMSGRSRLGSWGTVRWILLGILVYVLFMGALFGVCSYAFLPSDYSRSVAPKYFIDLYGINASDPDVGFMHLTLKREDASGNLKWHGPTLFGLSVIGSLSGGTAAVILASIFLINYSMRTLQLAPKTRQMQRNLYKVLLIQTAVPFVFSYIPLALMLFVPLTGVDLGSIGTIFLMITAVFPSIDGLLLVVMIPLFRSTIYRLLQVAVEAKMTFYIVKTATVAPESDAHAMESIARP